MKIISRSRAAQLVVAAIGFASCVPGVAHAMSMQISGTMLTLSGPVRSDDFDLFKDLLNSPAGQKVRVVRINSTGGFIMPAAEIARLIKRRGLATMVDGAGQCASACTIVFGGGVARHYVNSERVKDGLAGPGGSRGLAFHQGSAPLSRDRDRYSGSATGLVLQLYSELGVSGMRQFPDKATPRQVWQISGATALQHGIATSLSRP